MPIEENVRIAMDAFNRFRRPDAEARLVRIEGNIAHIEFSGAGNMENYMGHFKEKLEDICRSPVSIESKETNSASFIIEKASGSSDPTERALTIIDGYYDGAAHIKLGGEN